MKILVLVARLLLGLAFTVFGLNGFLHFMGGNEMPAGQAGAFLGAMFMSGYFYVVATVQLIGGLILLSGRFVALGLTLLAPVIVNIMIFHILMAPSGIAPGCVVSVLELYLLWAYRDRFAPILKP